MEHVFINQMQRSDTVTGCYVLEKLSRAHTADGRPYDIGAVSDVSGRIKIVMWNPDNTDVTLQAVGDLVILEGSVTAYNGQKQLTVSDMRTLTAEERQAQALHQLVPTTPLSVNEMYFSVLFAPYLGFREPTVYGSICAAVLNTYREDFCRYPAAMHIHHAYVGGLLTHAYGCLELARTICKQYQDQVPIDRSLLYAGAVLHDIGKLREFQLSPLGLVQDYTLEGKLEGHSALGAMMVGEIAKAKGHPAEAVTQLQHLILIHHGSPEKGAVVAPMCLEAELLAYIDGMDSRCGIYSDIYKDLLPGDFSSFQKALGKRCYRVA